MSNAGLLEIDIKGGGVTQGLGLDVKPYLTGGGSESPGRDPIVPLVKTADLGVDLFYNVTPSLRANLTVNTDFAQTEVDQRLVNLTRFPLFFPEKRDFDKYQIISARHGAYPPKVDRATVKRRSLARIGEF